MQELIKRIDAIINDYKHSITEENETFVSGVIYGLTISRCTATNLEKGEHND